MRRSLASQTVDQLGGDDSILARQRRDHAELDRLLDECLESRGRARAAALLRTTRLVFPHAFAEEAVLWPAVRRRLPDDAGLTTRIEVEHQEICELAARIDAAPPDAADLDDDRLAVLRRTAELLRRDARDEEDLVLPRLQEALGPAELRRMGRTWSLVRAIAPTRPHPTVSRRPPGNLLAALPLTVVDRTRDRLDTTAITASEPLAGWSRAASRRLARVAGAIEDLSIMQVGETLRTSARRRRRG